MRRSTFSCLLDIWASPFVKCLCVLVSYPSRSKLCSPALCSWRLTCIGCSRRFQSPQASVLAHPMGEPHQEIKSQKKERMGKPWLFLEWVTASWLTLSPKGHKSFQAALLVSVTFFFLCPFRPFRS